MPSFTARATRTADGQAMLAASNNVIREIVIDRSALMAHSGHLDDVKSAVADLINQSATGDTIGIIAFDGATSEVVALTDIVDQTTKDTIIAALNGITEGNIEVAGGDALQAALTALTHASVPQDTIRVVYFITTGSDNTGVNATTVMPGYQSAGIPIQVFGFDPLDSNETNLRLLADLTEGSYTTVRDLSGLKKAMRLTDQDTSPAQDVMLANDQALVEAGVPYSYTIAVDETLNELYFEFIYYGEALSATITLEDPDGTDWPVDPATECETYDSGTDDVETTCYIGFDNPLVGNWGVTVTTTEEIFVVDYETGVADADQSTYDAVVYATEGDVTEYPQPIVVEANVSRGYPIGGLGVTGWIYGPDGSTLSVNFRDDSTLR